MDTSTASDDTRRPDEPSPVIPAPKTDVAVDGDRKSDSVGAAKPAGNPVKEARVLFTTGGENTEPVILSMDYMGRTDMGLVEDANSAAMHELNEQAAAVTDRICRHIKAMSIDMINTGKPETIVHSKAGNFISPGVKFTSKMLDKDTDMRVYETDLPAMEKVILAMARSHFSERGIDVRLKIIDGVYVPFIMPLHGNVEVSIHNFNWRGEWRLVRTYFKQETFDLEAARYLQVVEGLCQKKARNLDDESVAKKQPIKK